MARTGNIFPTVGANVDRAGSTAWTSPGNVVSDNTTDATVVVPSDYLVTSSYGFTIPTDATIHGVIVRVEASESGTGSSNYVPQLHSNTTPTLIGAAKGAVTVNGTTKVISSNGASNDLWSATLTPTIVNAAGFGVSIWSTDTINTLAVDFVTIEIEFSQPIAVVPVRALRRRNNTNRRIRFARLNPQENGLPPSEPASDDRALEPGFITTTIRSRRALSIGWIAALASQPQAPAVPAVAAWVVVQVRRRREITRRLVVADPTPIERYTPPSIAWSDPPNVIRIEFRRTLQEQAPQLLFPPPTGPPVEYYPAWAARALPATSQHRHLRQVPEQPAYPQTPSAPSNDRTLEEPFITRTLRSRRALRLPDLVITAAPVVSQADLPAWQEKRATYRPSARKHRTVPDHAVYPPTPPSSTPAVYPSFVPTGFNRRRETERTLRTAAVQCLWPATPAQGAQPITATTGPLKTKRRKHRQGLFLSGGGVVEARVQPQFPSYATPPSKKRKPLKRRLLRGPALAAAPATPAVPAQPVTAWRQPKQHWIERARKLQPAAPQITHPATPVVAAQPVTAWRLPVANWIERRRTPRTVPRHEVYPVTPTYAANQLVEAIKRRETERRSRRAAHNPIYPATPAPPQPPTAFKLAEAFRRHGWRKFLAVLQLDERPATPPPAPVTRTGRHVKAGTLGRRGKASRERTIQAARRNRKLDAE